MTDSQIIAKYNFTDPSRISNDLDNLDEATLYVFDNSLLTCEDNTIIKLG